MGKQIKKIVITGGPCAGKTTGITRLPEVVKALGWRAIVVPEAATETFLAGVLYEDMAYKYFQYGIIINQIAKEKLFKYYAEHLADEKILLICDRGMMDGSAYCSEEDFDEIIKKAQISKKFARDSYDAVFHLVTAADGAEEFYNSDSNSTRKETPEEARILDVKTKNAWKGHSYLRIIDNSRDGFDAKIQWFIDEVTSFLKQ